VQIVEFILIASIMSEEISRTVSDRYIDEFIEFDSGKLLENYSVSDERDNGRPRPEDISNLTLRQKKLLTLSNCACYAAMGLAYGALGPSLEGFVESLGKSLEYVGGLLFTARGIGWIIGSFVAGPLYERVRGNRLLWISLVLTFVFSGVTPFVKNLYALVAINGVQGAFMSWVEVGVNTLTVWIWKEKVSPYMQLLHFAFGLGLSSFPIIAALSKKSLSIAYWIMSVAVLLTALFPFILKSPPIEKGVGTGHHVQESNNKAAEKDPSKVVTTSNEVRIVQKARYWVVVVCMTLFLLLYGGAENAFGGWAASYAVEVYKMPGPQAEYLDSVFWIAITIGRLLSVPLATRLSTRTILAFNLGGCLVTVIIMVNIAHLHIKSLLWICTVVLGLCMSSIYGAAFTVPAELKVKLSGKAASAFIIAAGIGDVGIPAVVSLMLKAVGNSALTWTLVGLLSICVAIYVSVFTFGITTMEKRLDEMELQNLSELDDQWSFSWSSASSPTVPLLNNSSDMNLNGS